MIHHKLGLPALGLLVTALTMSNLQLGKVLATPSHSAGSASSILGNISGILFNTLNSLLDSTRPLGGLGEPVLDLVEDCHRPSSSNSSACLPQDPDADRTVPQIIRSRGFRVEELPVTTDDGYILTVHRIVNPLVARADRAKLRPVLLQHGLMTSSVDWVINSVEVRPKRWPAAVAGHSKQRKAASHASHKAAKESPDHPNGLGFYLANEGFDVYLANSRGNTYSQRHKNLSAWTPDFWDFTFDQQIQFDLPATAALVQARSGRKKVAFVGHSQGTAMMFGLLAERPEFADVFEPVIMLAPVAFVGNVVSPARSFAMYTPIFQHVNMWFGSSTTAIRYLAPLVCGPQVVRRELCTNLIFLSSGFNEAEFNATRLSAYLAHLPSGTSVKNLAHYGQEVNSGRFAHFDHGKLANLKRYGQAAAPDYPLERVRSHSLVFFTADNDWLATPKDVAKLRASLRVKPYRTFNMTELMPKWNHVDFMYGKNSGLLVNSRVLQVLAEFHQDLSAGE